MRTSLRYLISGVFPYPQFRPGFNRLFDLLKGVNDWGNNTLWRQL